MIVLVPTSNRSDKALSAGLIKRLQAHPDIKCYTFLLMDNNDPESYEITEHYIQTAKPDWIICFGDRVEMGASARAAFLNKVKIAHVYAGIVADTKQATYDEIVRHQITLMADMCFCEDRASSILVYTLWETIGKIKAEIKDGELDLKNIHVVGITHFDDVIIDESEVPDEPYDLVLYNPITRFNAYAKMMDDWRDIMLFTARHPDKPNVRAIFVAPNRDKERKHDNPFTVAITFKEYTHAQFLGLLSHCRNFITNSSSGYYEAPHFLKEENILWVGIRNDLRQKYIKLEMGASDKIMEVFVSLLK